MSRFVAVNLDLSLLPFPASLLPPSFAAIFEARMASLKARFEEAGIPYDVEGLRTDPAGIVQDEDAYRELLDLMAMIDLAKGRMLAFAEKADLDQLAAWYGVKRAVIDPGDATASPPREPVLEDDSSLRRRVQLAPEAMSHGGTAGSYRHLALQAAPDGIKGVGLVKRRDAQGHPCVDVILLGRTGDGRVPQSVIDRVAKVFAAEDGAPLTDVVTVRSARIVPYTVDMILRVPIGPDPSLIRARAVEAITAAVIELHRIGEMHPLDAFYAAGRVGNVKKVILNAPIEDVTPGPDAAAYCAGISVRTEVVDG